MLRTVQTFAFLTGSHSIPSFPTLAEGPRRVGQEESAYLQPLNADLGLYNPVTIEDVTWVSSQRHLQRFDFIIYSCGRSGSLPAKDGVFSYYPEL